MNDATPDLVFADSKGNIMEFPGLAMVGRSGDYLLPISTEETITIPEGTQLYVIPGRFPIGMDRKTGEIIILTENPYDGSSPVHAVATFLSAAHTQTYISAWDRSECAPVLPLFPYTAVGWLDGFVTTGLRTDDSKRQDPDMYNQERIREGISKWRSEFPRNRLVDHLSSNCALRYGCPAALNLFQGREEAPLPTSPACNARCVGCISKQPCDSTPAPQDRIEFIPLPEEIAEVALKHIRTAEHPVVSFGQGCEGEPLLAADVIRDAISLIRAETSEGTINLNTNASLPHKVAELADAGLDSMRISMNSPREKTYLSYFRPSYKFEALMQSASEMKKRGKFVSLNLFVFPGVTDAPKEVVALKSFIDQTGIDMIQWRNLNIDPDLYLDTLAQTLPSGIGIRNLIESISVRRGYFNPYLGRK
jgi:pyruvate-formate lyase-activating enzyme